MYIETERIILRDFSLEDVPDVFEYAKNDKVGPPAGWAPHENIETTYRAVEDFIKNGTIALVPKQTGRVAGSIGLHDTSVSRLVRCIKSLELGYVLDERLWGRGLMTEAAEAVARHAFRDMGLGALWSGCFEGNERSRSVQRKLGFREAYVKKTHSDALNRDFVEHILFVTDDMFYEKRGR